MQDICSHSGELPSSYWLEDIGVRWRDYIARGGEACIYHGTLGDRKVVIREVSKPSNADWTSLKGQHVIKVSSSFSGTVKTAQTSVIADQTRSALARSTSAPERDSLSGDMARL